MAQDKKKVTIQDIARVLKITPSAVSKALNDHPRISDRTKQAVQETARRLNYQPNNLASALRSGRSYLWGVIVPAIDYAFFSSVVRGIEEVATRAGYNIIISQSTDSFEKETASVDALIKTRADGVLASIANSTTSFHHFRRMIDHGIPLVLFDRTSDELPVNSVAIDDYQGARRAVHHLLEEGCRRIVHLAGYGRLPLFRHRIEGYRDALTDFGLPVDDRLIIESDLSMEDGERIIRRLLQSGFRPDGIFAASDHAALGAMHVVQQAGLAIPQEVAIVGFSNEPFSSFIRPGLSSVDQKNLRMGQLAANLLLERLEKPDEAPRKTILAPELVVRESSRRGPPQPPRGTY